MDPLSDDERHCLHDLERDLNLSDPGLARKMAAPPPEALAVALTWPMLAVSFVLIGLDGELFLLSLRRHSLWLLLLTAALFAVAIWPLTGRPLFRRRSSSGSK